MIPQAQVVKRPSDALSPLAKAAALEALDALQNPENRDLVMAAANMRGHEIVAILMRCAGKLAVGEATEEEIRGCLLMGAVWASERDPAMPAH